VNLDWRRAWISRFRWQTALDHSTFGRPWPNKQSTDEAGLSRTLHSINSLKRMRRQKLAPR
jgi:hypothetical protein